MQYSPIARQRRAGVKGQRQLRSRVAQQHVTAPSQKTITLHFALLWVGQVRFVMVR